MEQKATATPLPKGFLTSGIIAGIKEDKGKKDLGLIVTEQNAVLGAVYTRNKFPSAHVEYCRQNTPTTSFRALVVNSGNANAATGEKGKQANQRLAEKLALILQIDQKQVFTSSTGIIGRPFPIDIIEASLPKLVNELKSDCNDAAEAIMTTDTKSKLAIETLQIGDQQYTVTGFAKGSGMIHPDMATMLAYILTDAPLPPDKIQALTGSICERSFNCVSVDGDTSTNDSFYLISSNPNPAVPQDQLSLIEESITKVAVSLAKQIAADGEGARHLIEVQVVGAPSPEISKRVLRAVLTSSLVKTAVYGNDPNWGRLMAAAGNGLAESTFTANDPLSISIQDIQVLKAGEPVDYDEAKLIKAMNEPLVKINLDLHLGDDAITGWGCDLTEEYIHINADYTT